jgi:hypothetical protein
VTQYTDSDKIAAALGATLTFSQATQADVMAAAASDFIERALDRSWLGWTSSTAISVDNERQTVKANRIWLNHPPVVAVSSVSVRARAAGATVSVLDQPWQYELIEPALGEVVFSPSYEGQRVEIDYTSKEPIPPVIAQFATELAAGMLALSLAGAGAATAAAAGIRRYTLWGGDLSVEYAVPTSAQQSGNTASSSTRLPALWSEIERMFSRKPAVV